MEQVILVDKNDHEVGIMEKMEAHRSGTLHRAISVFIFNADGQLLLQQRAADKYHCPGKWSNTCCSHPRPGEPTMDAARRRLQEEMGMDCWLVHWCALRYLAAFDNGLTEHEYDHIFLGVTNQLPSFNPREVSAYQYIRLEELNRAIEEKPDRFTPWLSLCLAQIELKKRAYENSN